MATCPLFTEHHELHSTVWSVPGCTLPILCLACITERLENRNELNIHIKMALTELKALLYEGKNSKALSVLKSDSRVLERLCGNLFGRLS